jgi:hypothetical protein
MCPQQQNKSNANRDKKEKDMPEAQPSSRAPNQNQQNSERKQAPRPEADDSSRQSKSSPKDRDENNKNWKTSSR